MFPKRQRRNLSPRVGRAGATGRASAADGAGAVGGGGAVGGAGATGGAGLTGAGGLVAGPVATGAVAVRAGAGGLVSGTSNGPRSVTSTRPTGGIRDAGLTGSGATAGRASGVVG